MATFWGGSTEYSPFVQAGGMNFNNPQGSYNSAYQAAAQTNRNLYSQAMAGFAAQQQQAQAAQSALNRQYAQLRRGTMRMLQGSNRANLQDIADQYTRMSGAMSQQLIDRGLGNTTVQQSVERGVSQDYAKERTRSENAFAQLMAQSNSQLGLAGLGAQQRGNEFLSGLQGDQMRYLASISAPYPDPSVYAAMASRMGGGGGMGMMPGMPGPSPALGPTGGYTPNIFGSGAAVPDFTGGGYGGLGGWATGYGMSAGGYGGGGGYNSMSGLAYPLAGGEAVGGTGFSFGGGGSPYGGAMMGGYNFSGGGGDF